MCKIWELHFPALRLNLLTLILTSFLQMQLGTEPHVALTEMITQVIH